MGAFLSRLHKELFSQDVLYEDGVVMRAMQRNPYPHRIEQYGGAIRQHFSIIDSTQVQAGYLIDMLPKNTWLILTAEEQTAGRGTHGRKWFSPPKENLYVTFVIPFPKKNSSLLFFMSQVAAVAVSRVLKLFGVAAAIKWPNDLILNNKKVCGILSENKTSVASVDYSALLVGIGINVNMAKSLCEGLDQPATSVSVEVNRKFDNELMLQCVYQELKRCVHQLLDQEFSSFHEELNAQLAFRGELITVDRNDEELLQGFFVGVDDMGRMQLRVADGQIMTLQNGRIQKGLSMPQP